MQFVITNALYVALIYIEVICKSIKLYVSTLTCMNFLIYNIRVERNLLSAKKGNVVEIAIAKAII